MTEKDIHEETDSEKRHFSPQKGNDQTGEPAFEGGIKRIVGCYMKVQKKS